jgi:hypothetical protein
VGGARGSREGWSGWADAVGAGPAETGGLNGGSASSRGEDGPRSGGPAIPIEPMFQELSTEASLSASRAGWHGFR